MNYNKEGKSLSLGKMQCQEQYKLQNKIVTKLHSQFHLVIMNGMLMPFGLKKAPLEFQNIMNDIFTPYTNFIIVYIDDVLVFQILLINISNIYT